MWGQATEARGILANTRGFHPAAHKSCFPHLQKPSYIITRLDLRHREWVDVAWVDIWGACSEEYVAMALVGLGLPYEDALA